MRLIRDKWNLVLPVSLVVIVIAGCVGDRLIRIQQVIKMPHPLGPRMVTNTVVMTRAEFELAAVIATNISAVHTTVTLINLEYDKGLPVIYINKAGVQFVYSTRVWWWETSNDLWEWQFGGWATNPQVTMRITNEARFYRGWNVPHGYSLRMPKGQPQPPDL